ncbi:GntR family transcriptional regulator [Neptunicoccus sediminis]|uniref:GntR family transcriptional regulator n=1 Tax=Neptunicoccus sediminis TaxID=1892596 RepID=UPI00084600CB|nr:GntR family transcriptional regulator [Neptunicoccus sediminis]
MSSLASLKPLEDTTIRGRTVDQLRRLVVTGELAAGMRLTETELACALGISRGPLREAIRELVDIGLLVSKPYKGLFVREITRKDLEEIYSLRTMLEKFAFQEAWDKRTPEALEDLNSRNERLITTIGTGSDPFGPIEAELHLHSWCYELSGHSLLLQSWNRLKPNLQFYFAMHQQAHARQGPERKSHDLYIRLASGTDLEAMLDHLNDHMRQGLETTIGFINTA